MNKLFSQNLRTLTIMVFIVNSLSCFSCSHYDKISRNIKKETRLMGSKLTCTAYTKDSTQRGITFGDTGSKYFRFYSNNFFETIQLPCFQNCKLSFYAGYYRISNDTIFLQYYKSYKPGAMAD